MDHNAINNAFTAEILDAVLSNQAGAPEDTVQTQIMGIIKADPLSVFTDERGMSRATTTAKEKASEKKEDPLFGKKSTRNEKRHNNIFKDFGRDKKEVVHVDIGGIQRQRVNFTRHWQNDSDLRRWHRSLDSESRHDRLVEEMRERVNPEYGYLVTVLAQRHNGLFRQRDPIKPKIMQGSDELRELQSVLMQKRVGRYDESELRDMLEQFSRNDDKIHAQLRDMLRTRGKREIAFFNLIEFLYPLVVHKPVEHVFGLSEDSGNVTLSSQDFKTRLLSMGFGGETKAAWSFLDAADAGAISIAQLQKLKPYLTLFQKLSLHMKLRKRSLTTIFDQAMLEEEDDDDGEDPREAFRREMAKKRGLKSHSEPFLPAIGPDGRQTRAVVDGLWYGLVGRPPITLLVYRNADHVHVGEAIFIRKMPATMGELLELIGEQCAPMVRPVQALLDGDLKRVKKIDDVKSGGAYLLKGSEVLIDPPAPFCAHGQSDSFSVRQINAMKREAMKKFETPSVREQFDIQALSDKADGAAGGGGVHGAHEGTARTSASLSSLTSPGAFWRVDKQLARKLGIANTRHRDWGIQPVLSTSAAY